MADVRSNSCVRSNYNFNSFISVFDTVEALTRGGPSKSTYVMVYAMFEKGVKQNLIGMGSTLTIVFLGFVLLLTLTQVYFINRKVHYS